MLNILPSRQPPATKKYLAGPANNSKDEKLFSDLDSHNSDGFTLCVFFKSVWTGVGTRRAQERCAVDLLLSLHYAPHLLKQCIILSGSIMFSHFFSGLY